MGCVCGCGPWRLLTPSVVVVVEVEVGVVVLVLEVVAAAVCGLVRRPCGGHKPGRLMGALPSLPGQ